MWDFFLPQYLRLTHCRLKNVYVGLFLTSIFKTHSLPAKNRLCGTFSYLLYLRLTHYLLKTGYVGLFLPFIFKTHSLLVTTGNECVLKFLTQVPNSCDRFWVSSIDVNFFKIKFEITNFEVKSLSRPSFRSPHFWCSRFSYSRLQSFPKII